MHVILRKYTWIEAFKQVEIMLKNIMYFRHTVILYRLRFFLNIPLTSEESR